ncbi:MAG: hypothetical protein IIZ97_10015 [Prevotella sp.]|nr:hypothetical protein [Prevotella sp.]
MMYYKMIGDRMVFSDCHTIQTNEGVWISNPTDEQIAAAGWLPYVPPVIPPQPQTEPDIDMMVAAVKRMLDASVEELSDEEALEVSALFPTWVSKMGMQVNVGERYWYDGRLWKVIQAHTVQEDWTPDTAVSLFVEVSIEEWPQWVQPQGVQDAYMTGDKVTYEGVHYVSLIDNNVWSPAALPSGWEARP